MIRRSTAATIVIAALLSPTAGLTQTAAIDLDGAAYIANTQYPGVETAVVFGDPDAEGLYATHARVAAGARIPPHTHPNPLTTVVTAGTAFVGTGRVFDEAALRAYPAASMFVTPAGSPHFISAADGAFAILDHGSGPTAFTLAGDAPD